MKIKLRCLSLILLSILIISCGSKSQLLVDKESSFLALFPKCEMNSSIRFLPVEVTFKSTKSLFLDFGNYSQNIIVFPFGDNVKIYRYDKTNSGQWLTVENKIDYMATSNEKIDVRPLSDGPENAESVDIFPVLNNNSPTTMRVVVTSDSPDKCFGAFIDIQVSP